MATFCLPTARVNLCVPPAPGIVPILISGRPNLASSAAYIISHCPSLFSLTSKPRIAWEFIPPEPSRTHPQTVNLLAPQTVHAGSLRYTHSKANHGRYGGLREPGKCIGEVLEELTLVCFGCGDLDELFEVHAGCTLLSASNATPLAVSRNSPENGLPRVLVTTRARTSLLLSR